MEIHIIAFTKRWNGMKKLIYLISLVFISFTPLEASEYLGYNSDILIPIGLGLTSVAIWSIYEFQHNDRSVYIPITGLTFGAVGISFLCVGFYYFRT